MKLKISILITVIFLFLSIYLSDYLFLSLCTWILWMRIILQEPEDFNTEPRSGHKIISIVLQSVAQSVFYSYQQIKQVQKIFIEREWTKSLAVRLVIRIEASMGIKNDLQKKKILLCEEKKLSRIRFGMMNQGNTHFRL